VQSEQNADTGSTHKQIRFDFPNARLPTAPNAAFESARPAGSSQATLHHLLYRVDVRSGGPLREHAVRIQHASTFFAAAHESAVGTSRN
jgi:hypothetical protein